MKRIESIPGKVFLISTFLNFGGRLSWENNPRGNNDPCLWSCLLETEAEADAYLSKLKQYALIAQKVSSIRTPGKFRVGIRLNSLDVIDDNRINLKKLYEEKLIALTCLLSNQVERLKIDWMKVCCLKDNDTYLPVLAIEYPGAYAYIYDDLVESSTYYSEVCLQIISKVFATLLERAGVDNNKRLIESESFKTSIYCDMQKDVSYLMLNFNIIPTLFNLAEIAEKIYVRNVIALFFKQTSIPLPCEVGIKIAETGSLTSKDADAVLASLNINREAEPPKKKF
jgi:hypothetical protein